MGPSALVTTYLGEGRTSFDVPISDIDRVWEVDGGDQGSLLPTLGYGSAQVRGVRADDVC